MTDTDRARELLYVCQTAPREAPLSDLFSLLDAEHPESRDIAADALAEVGAAAPERLGAWVPSLVAALESDHRKTARSALVRTSFFHPRPVVDALARTLERSTDDASHRDSGDAVGARCRSLLGVVRWPVATTVPGLVRPLAGDLVGRLSGMAPETWTATAGVVEATGVPAAVTNTAIDEALPALDDPGRCDAALGVLATAGATADSDRLRTIVTGLLDVLADPTGVRSARVRTVVAALGRIARRDPAAVRPGADRLRALRDPNHPALSGVEHSEVPALAADALAVLDDGAFDVWANGESIDAAGGTGRSASTIRDQPSRSRSTPRGYETRALADPESVDPERLVAYLAAADPTDREAAATAARHVAEQRPERLRGHVPELLGTVRGWAVSDLAVDCGASPSGEDATRDGVADALAAIGGVAPGTVLPTLHGALEEADPAVRAVATGALARIARTCPAVLAGGFDRYAAALDDGARPVRRNALGALTWLVADRPDAAVALVPRGTASIRTGRSSREDLPAEAAIAYLAEVAVVRPTAVDSAVAPVVGHLRDRPAADLSRYHFDLLARLAPHRPSAVARARSRLDGLADSVAFPAAVGVPGAAQETSPSVALLSTNVLVELDGAGRG